MKAPYYKIIVAMAAAVSALSSCKKDLNISPPTNSISTATAFNNIGTINSAMASLYYNFSTVAVEGNVVPQAEMLADNAYNPTMPAYRFSILASYCQTNNISAATVSSSSILDFCRWSVAYQAIYKANLILEGMSGASAPGLTDAMKAAYIGAAKTVRAYAYFQLVRGYGDVPLVTSTSIDSSQSRPRDSKTTVYVQIEKDLNEAMANLPATSGTRNYIASKYIPEAILASVYLTEGKWAAAEAAASDIIGSNIYQLSPIANVFLQSSAESILTTTGYAGNTGFALASKESSIGWFLLPQGTAGNTASLESQYPALSPDLLSAFEPGDLRRSNWVVLSNVGGYADTMSRMFSYKYKYNVAYYTGTIPAGKEEDNKIIRLAEVYLIRAEARARQNNLSGAAGDLNMIRTRAGLANTTAATQQDMINAVLKERRVELFFEKGDRWFDLVRTGTANTVLPAISYKAANWKPYMVLFPLWQTDLSYNPNLTQTPGY